MSSSQRAVVLPSMNDTEEQTAKISRRTVKDKQTMKEIVLTDQELEMIDNIQNKRYPASADDPYQVRTEHKTSCVFRQRYRHLLHGTINICFVFLQPYIDHFTSIKMDHPISNRPEPKSRFLPSKWEHKKASLIPNFVETLRKFIMIAKLLIRNAYGS